MPPASRRQNASAAVGAPLATNGSGIGSEPAMSSSETLISRRRMKPHLYTNSDPDAPSFCVYPNSAVRTGYRGQLSYSECWGSLFYMHNQWAIIWTFIAKIPLSALACALICTLGVQDSKDLAPFILLFASCLVHTPVSILYHMFLCVSPEVKLAWNRADYALIYVMTVIITYTLGYYTFHCHPTFRIAQMICCGVPALINVVFAVTPLYEKAAKTRVLRTSLAAVVITLALLPVFFSAATTGFIAPYYAAGWGLGACVSYVLGGLIWVLHIPERWVPIVFDNNLNSHAIMHVCIVVSHLLFYMFVFRGYQYQLSVGFVCS